jgi:hydroxymethylpyrimidine pyrophosphatase-like HAD family hydrolase
VLPRYLVADVDDTFTVGGHLHPAVLAAVARAAAAGIELVLNTGRPAGYGAALLSYLPHVSAVIVENGGAWLDRGAPAPGPRSAAGSDHGELPLQFALPPPIDLRERLVALRQRVADRLGLLLRPTADSAYRVTDHTAVRTLPPGAAGAAVLAQLSEAVAEESAGQGSILASSIHIHFMLDGDQPRSKARGTAALLAQRGVADPAAELARWAVAVGDSANDASLFAPGCFALSVGVANIERYLPELGALRPRHLTKAAEGLGFCELIDDLLRGTVTLG